MTLAQLFVGCIEHAAGSFRESYIHGVVYGEIAPEFPCALQQKQMGVALYWKVGKPLQYLLYAMGLETSAGHQSSQGADYLHIQEMRSNERLAAGV
jgi:hypothetical protein